MGTKACCITILLCFSALAKSIELEPRCSKYDFEEKVLEKMVRVEHRVEILTGKYDELLNEIKDVSEKLQDIEERLQDCPEQAKRELETALMHYRKTGFVFAFSAYSVAETSPSVNDVMKFTKTVIDEDGVYSNTTGKFTAPVNGVYMFTSTLCTNAPLAVRVEFVANDVTIGRFRVSDEVYSECSSGTAMGSIPKGSKAWIKVLETERGVIHNQDQATFNSFAGYLLQEIV